MCFLRRDGLRFVGFQRPSGVSLMSFCICVILVIVFVLLHLTETRCNLGAGCSEAD